MESDSASVCISEPPEKLGPYRIVRALGRGGMGIVYLGEHVETREEVALKTVSVTQAKLLSSIRREIHALRRVDHPSVVRIVAEGVEGAVPWYAMELLEGETLRSYIAGLNPTDPSGDALEATLTIRSSSGTLADCPEDEPTATRARGQPAEHSFTPPTGEALPRTLTLMRAVCDALAFVHGMGLVHRDLKPDNVFLRDGDTPVLVDFGLALQVSGVRGREVLEVGEQLEGTPAYMAPEQIRGKLIDARADLYALGCMLYESVTGTVPFVGSVSNVLQQHLYHPPAPPSTRASNVPPALDELILKLLQKRPQDRIGYADDVAAALGRLGAENRACRRKASAYLYRPELAGRIASFVGLEEPLERARRARGGRALIGGESGIGKTRFAMEVATAAIQQGLRVITGECTAVSAAEVAASAVKAAPLHPFRNLLLAIADHCGQKGPAETARILGDRGPVLAAYEPSLGQLAGQERYAELPILAAPAARTRLHTCLAAALAAFAQTQPLLLVIDDLQWADENSLSFLQFLDEAYFQSTGVLILGTYRSEETSEELRKLLGAPGVTRIDLGRLDAMAVRRMVSDMLAMPAPPAPFIEFLIKQSEGNPFFIAEYLRAAIAERVLFRNDAGQWHVEGGNGQEAARYDALALPGELRNLVIRRVAGLGAGARALASMAAVLGREIDAEVLAIATRLDDLGNLDAVEELRVRQILEVDGGRLRFPHDKLREILYGEIPEPERRRLHAAAAAAIEAHYAGAPELLAFYPILAHHFSIARTHDKALYYLEKAGGRALDMGASAEALAFFRKAVELDDGLRARGDEPASPLRRASFERQLGLAAFNLANFREADRFTRAALYHLRGGRVAAGGREPPAASMIGALFAILFHLVLQMMHLYGPKWRRNADPVERRRLRDACHAAERLSEIFFLQNDVIRAVGAALQAANLAERLGPSPELARGYATLGLAFHAIPLRRVVNTYMARAREVAEASADPQATLWVSFLAGITAYVSGQWAEARASFGHALALARAVQDHRRAESCLALLAKVERTVGEPQNAFVLDDELWETANKSGDMQGQLWALAARAEWMIAFGRADEALELFEQHLELNKGGRFDPSEQITQGQVALIHLMRSDFERARRVAESTFEIIAERSATGFQFLDGYVANAEVFFELWERATTPEERSALGRSARRALGKMRAYARLFPIGRPYAQRFRGLCEVVSGRPRRAERAFARSLAEAERLSMPVAQGLAHYEIGRHRPPGDPARAAHLEQARAIFDRLGRRHWLERTLRLLADKPASD